MVVTCDIQFEKNSEAIYYAGQVITGKITLTTDKIKQVKAINLTINGSAQTKWLIGHSKRNIDATYSGHVNYINTVTCLLESNIKEQSVIIEPGIHTFNFACHIPVNCPSSFEGDDGFIRYEIQVSLQRPWKYDQTFTKAFTVLAIMNLNDYSSSLKLPVKADITKSFCCRPFTNDRFQLSVQLPQTGYVPGQLIPVSILITNETLACVKEMCVRLVMLITYFSTVPENSKSEKTTIAKLVGDPVQRHCTHTYNYYLPIPATPPTCTTLCSLINITYRVEVEAKMRSIFLVDQCVHTAVTIGNVPLQADGMVVQLQPRSRTFNLETVTQITSENFTLDELQANNEPVTYVENMEPWSAIENIPSTVYMEASHMPQSKLSENCENSFTPKYPVFNIPSPTSLYPNIADETDSHGVISMVMDPNRTTWL